MNYSTENNSYFSSPFIGNGELALQISPDGTMSKYTEKSKIKGMPSRRIWWEARRQRNLVTKNLIPFGLFTQTLTANEKTMLLTGADETLDCAGAAVLCDAEYEGETHVYTKAFVHINCDVVALEKKLVPRSGTSLLYTFTYRFAGKDNDDGGFPDYVEGTASAEENGGTVTYRITDQKTAGIIRVFCDIPVSVSTDNNAVSLSLTVDRPVTAHFYLIFADTNGLYSDYSVYSAEKVLEIRKTGFDGFYRSHKSVWDSYYQEGYASVGDKKTDDVYLTAQYHLRIFTTRWSIPVGLNDASWDGRFFAFDEHYPFSGLLTSNHLSLAKRVPDFRAAGLRYAVSSFSSGGQNEARYPWETIEDGTDATTPGFWHEHIFHMAVITLTEYEYYRYSGDEAYLKNTAWNVISACAEFFYKHYVYVIEGGKTIIGKCTDLERLGSSVSNAYMTTCGVICTFRIFAACARHLGIQKELADQYEKTAEKLLDGLPEEDGRYVPYPGCPERSIAVFTGTYPFDVIRRDDERQTRAIADFLINQDTFGNMYSIGRGVCAWYACWKALTFARLGRGEDACREMKYVAENAGDFNELFEINNKESDLYIHPWFSTAAGKFVSTVNEILLQSNEDGSEITIAPALSEDYPAFSFRLSAKGGMTVEASSENGTLSVHVIGNEHCRHTSVQIRVPARYGKDCIVRVERTENAEK